MSTKEKLVERFKSLPSDFTFDELVRLLNGFGYSQSNKGATSGSRVSFKKDDDVLMIHKPHPGNILKYYVIKRMKVELKKRKLI